MCAILNLLGENVAGVDLAGDMLNSSGAVGADLADLGFAEITVIWAFIGTGCGPRNRSGVVVVNSVGSMGFGHSKIGSAKFDFRKFKGTFVGDVDFGLARALDGLVLTDGTSCDGATAAEYYKAGEGEKIKQFEGGAFRRGSGPNLQFL